MNRNNRNQDHGNGKVISIISNGLLAAGAAIGLFVMAKAYLFTDNLEPGTCPLTLNRPWLYLSLGLLGASLILSFFEPKREKRDSR